MSNAKPNLKYDEKLYNEDVKNLFLSNYPPETIRTLLRIFRISSKFENDLKKDIYDFNREQIRKLLFLYMPRKINSSKQNGTIIGNYIDWAIENGYTFGINPLDGIPKDWHDQFVDKRIKQYFTEDELSSYIKDCENKQDAVIISMLREGVGGEGGFEMTSLRERDIDSENNTLRLHDKDGGVRKIVVSDECITLCLAALNESIYYKSNGQINTDTKSPTTNLIDNDYVLKSSLTRTENMEQASKNIIHRRLAVLSKFFDQPHLKPRNIAYSGMLIMARELMKRDGKLGRHQYNEICERFNQTKAVSGSSDYNYSRLKAEFLNEEKVRELYPDEFEAQ